MLGTMGERLAWARNQQGFILQQVSDKSGLAIGYISQLEKGAKVNPTIDALARLAKALNISLAYVLGEVEPVAKDGTVSSNSWQIGHAFLRRMSLISPRERERLMLMSVEERFIMVTDFLCEEFPALFTRPVVAFQLGISVRGLNDILERNNEVSEFTLRHMVQLSAIPHHFFATGKLDAPEVGNTVTPADLIRFHGAISLAIQKKFSPEELSQLIGETGRR